MKKSRFPDSQILAIIKQAESDVPASGLCREHVMSAASFYKWWAKYGGMDASLMGRMKELGDKNRRLKKMYAEERLKSEIIQEAMAKRVQPSQRKKMAQASVINRAINIQLACSIFFVSETCYRYQAKLSGENRLIADWFV
jgi:putative transposase